MKKKEIEMMEEKIRHEESMNKSKLHKINIGKNEYLEQSTKNQDYIEATVKQMKDLETKLFTENHTRDNLTIEKKKLVDVNNSLKGENQTMGRQITQDKYHNKTGDEEKKRRVYLEKVTDDYLKMTKKIEEDQALLEQEIERNEDPNLLKNQKAYTTELQNDHQQIQNNILVAKAKITDLQNRQRMLNDAIYETLTEKRRSDKLNMELEDMANSRGRHFTEEMIKKRQRHEERKLRIGKE